MGSIGSYATNRANAKSALAQGRAARDAALAAFMPVITDVVRAIGPEKIRATLPVLRELRQRLDES